MPFVTRAILCREVRRDEEGSTSLIQILDAITILDEGLTELPMMGVVRVFAESAGEYPFRAVVVSPSGKVASTDFRLPVRFDEDETDREMLLDLVLRTEEEGIHWFQVSVGAAAPTRVPLEVRWAPDVRRAR